MEVFLRTEREDQLLDMIRDRNELRNVISEHPEIAERLRRELRRTIIGLGKDERTAFRTEDEELLDELKALGYID